MLLARQDMTPILPMNCCVLAESMEMLQNKEAVRGTNRYVRNQVEHEETISVKVKSTLFEK